MPVYNMYMHLSDVHIPLPVYIVAVAAMQKVVWLWLSAEDGI